MSKQASLENASSTNSQKPEGVDKENSRFDPIRIERDEFGNIPQGWKYLSINELSEYVKSGCSESQNKSQKGLPVTRIETIANGTVNYDKVGFVPSDKIDTSKYLLEKGDLLFSNINSRKEIGKTAIYKGKNTLYHGMNLLRISFSDKMNNFFGYYLFDSDMGYKIFYRNSQAAVGQSSINQGQLKSINLPVPPKQEQRRIASVFYNVDQAIQKTEEIIEQTKRVKKGLMQDLFTEGYCNHEDFKDEGPLEKRPADWKIRSLNKVADIEMGSSPKSRYYNKEKNGLPFYQGNNEFGHRSPETKVWCNNPVKTAQKDDILISVRAPVGDLNIATEKCCIGRGLAGITAKEIDRDYLFYHLKERENFLIRISAGSTYDSINSSQLKNLNLKIPNLGEQKKIAKTLDALDGDIDVCRKRKSQLHLIKKGLMQDLLTGKVRTKDKDIEVLDEVLEVEK